MVKEKPRLITAKINRYISVNFAKSMLFFSFRLLTKGMSANVEIKINKPICVELYQNYRELGRFMLRSAGATIAAGQITDIL